jgi:PleD family two-component response regulator
MMKLREADRRKDEFLASLAHDGLAAVQAAERFRPDVVLAEMQASPV